MTLRQWLYAAITQEWPTGIALIVMCALLTLFAAVTPR